MPEQQEPTLGDMVIEDLERQLAEPDPRYARRCRELAMVRSQYTLLLDYVRAHKDVLGLTEVGADGSPLGTEEKDKSAELADPGPSAQNSNGKVAAAKGSAVAD